MTERGYLSGEISADGNVAATTLVAKRGSTLFRVLRPVVSAALLILLFQSVGLSRFMDILAGASIAWLASGLLLVIAALAISAYKWQWLLAVQNVRVPLPKLFTSYLVGLFFNNFLPTNIGGDVVRIADIGRHTWKMPEAAASSLPCASRKHSPVLVCFSLFFTMLAR